jgi:hypothetical protein
VNQNRPENDHSEVLDLVTYVSSLSPNTFVNLAIAPAADGVVTRTFSLHAGSLQGIVRQHEPPNLVPKPKSRYRKSQAQIIKVAHEAGLIVERLLPDGSVEVSDNNADGLTKQANGQGGDSWEEAISRETH